MANKDELKQMMKRATMVGWQILRSKNGHLIWLSPCGKFRVVTSSTPSDNRALKNIEADLRRAGLDLKKQGRK